MAPFVARFAGGKALMWAKIRRSGVRTKFIFGSDLVEWDTDGAVFRFLEEALRDGEYVLAPEAEVVGNGLEKLQEGMDLVRAEGARGKKVVVSLE
ncbi:hypothetical protein G7046_g8730 [Stylonectria norvegica]|nr:hypothetical protein G7046_g8730 [Stylonectria norvegica]